ncbi:MAG: MAPEG family protein [Pseudomonadota bacterium]|nr:MAPEG family protein [Pseudomonadota bacterium]|tara:strand:+ start:406 stop:807 length:402 start_codon:yes stop_codon:yes gene_type:complete
MTQTALLTPVFTLILWTFAITAIMAYGRVRFTKDPQDAAHTRDLKGMMPAWVERTADNYNHLFEQPVAFYVVTLSIALMNNIEPLMVQLAWGFVFVRIIHSLVQLTINIVLLRFAIFAIGWLIIAYMALSQLI